MKRLNDSSRGASKKDSVNATWKTILPVFVSCYFLWMSAKMRSLTRDGVSSSSSSFAAKSPNGKFAPKALPSHPFPNAELAELVGSHRPYRCPEGLVYVADQIQHDKVTHPRDEQGNPARLIPRLLHITSKTRCMTPDFVKNIDKWKGRMGPEYSVYIHDDAAVEKFLYKREWTEFPELAEVLGCVTSGAGKADIWRYLMIWEFGGFYVDMDVSPTGFSPDSVSEEDDAFMPLEGLGIVAQYFFSASPRHPMIYFSAKFALQELAFRMDIGNNNAAKTTGPGAFKNGFILFMRAKGIRTNGYVEAETYIGAHDRTIRVVGDKKRHRAIVLREAVKAKKDLYPLMNMTHFHKARDNWKRSHGTKKTGCLEHRWNMHMNGASWNPIM